MRKIILLTSILAVSAAQGNILYNGGTATENFNSIPVVNNDTRVTLTGTGTVGNQVDLPGLPGWQATRIGGTGTGNIALWDDSSGGAGGRFYAYGDGTNRSMGMLASGATIGAFGVSYVNDTSDTFNQVTISYTRQIWHVQGTSTESLYETRFEFGYGSSANGSTSDNYLTSNDMVRYPALDAISPEENTVTGTSTGTNPDRSRFGAAEQWSELVTATIDGVEWAPGETLFLRWVDFDAPGFDAGMSVDDFSMTAAIPEPSTVALTMGLLAGLGVWLRRRKN